MGTSLTILLLYYLMIRYFHLEQYRNQVSVGFSCVVFGWMTIISQFSSADSLDLFGYIKIPINFAPFVSLVVTSILIRQASFVGHLSGILFGYLIAWNEMFKWNLYSNHLFFDSFVWISISILWSIKTTTNWLDKYIVEIDRNEPTATINSEGILTRRQIIQINVDDIV